jgi:hypothetical protein
MGAHRFIALGAWGGKQCTIAAARCGKCGCMYVAINFTADPTGRILALGEDGEHLPHTPLDGGCPLEG